MIISVVLISFFIGLFTGRTFLAIDVKDAAATGLRIKLGNSLYTVKKDCDLV